MIINVEQGSEEWHMHRVSSLGASQIEPVMAKGKGGTPSVTRSNLMAELAAERLTGCRTDSFCSDDMRRGQELEADARRCYEFIKEVEVAQIGMFKHDRISFTHASPDGVVGDDGLIEIKCQKTKSHIGYLLGDEIPRKYILQMQWQMACSDGRAWVDFVSYDPRMPVDLQLFVKRFHRDQPMIDAIESYVTIFLQEVDEMVARLESVRK